MYEEVYSFQVTSAQLRDIARYGRRAANGRDNIII